MSTADTGRTTPLWGLVAQREITTRIRDKAFLGSTGFTLLLLIGVFVVTSIFSGGTEEYDVAVLDPDAALVAVAEPFLQQSTEDSSITAEVVEDRAAAEALVRDGEVDAALLPTGEGYEVVGDDGVPSELRAALAGAVSAEVMGANAAERDVDLEALYAGTTVGERLLDPNADEGDARALVAFAFALIFLLTAMTFGMTIAQSVVQEKESRVVEILAAAVPIRALLWGKIAGNSVLALGQILLMAAVGIGGLLATGRDDLLAGIGPAIGWYIVLFVIGFLALAALWSVAGSIASRQEDLQSTTLPGQLLLFVPYFISAFGSDQVQTVMSMVPIVSTMVLPGRMAQGEVPGWQVAVAILVTVLAAVVLVRIGSRIYERTLLRTGGKIGYREALRLSE